MRRYTVDLNLTRDQVLRLYEGSANAVVCRDRSSLRVRFPLQSLRRFVDTEGINGTLTLSVDPEHRLRGIERLSKGAAGP